MQQRYSRQREEIYEAVHRSKAHPTAEMVYQELKPRMPKLSLGTVYRNLHQMACEGRLVELPGAVARFDAGTAPHTHLQCIRCGGLMDLEGLPYDAALDEAAGRSGCRILGHMLVFTGICAECRAKERAEEVQ